MKGELRAGRRKGFSVIPDVSYMRMEAIEQSFVYFHRRSCFPLCYLE